MYKTFLMCKAGKKPAQCGFGCKFCYAYDTVQLALCDVCNLELTDDEFEKYTKSKKMLCDKCRAKEEVSFDV